jgi:uncharacterized protein YwqG
MPETNIDFDKKYKRKTLAYEIPLKILYPVFIASIVFTIIYFMITNPKIDYLKNSEFTMTAKVFDFQQDGNKDKYYLIVQYNDEPNQFDRQTQSIYSYEEAVALKGNEVETKIYGKKAYIMPYKENKLFSFLISATLIFGPLFILSVIIFIAIKYRKWQDTNTAQIKITEMQVYEIISFLKNKKRKQAVKVFINRGECDIYSSKLGGEYHGEKIDGFQFLGQINWAEVPYLDGYPKAGLLQFFIDEMTGHKCKLRYFKAVGNPFGKKYETAKLENIFGYSPLNYKEMPLTFKKFTDHITYVDDEFDDIFAEVTEKVCGKKYKFDDFKNTPSLYGSVSKEFAIEDCSKIGGNPKIPWGNDNKQTQLLFECANIPKFAITDADSTPPVNWGGYGVADFFISKTDLETLLFDDILFKWDYEE